MHRQQKAGCIAGGRRSGLTLVELLSLIALISLAFLIASRWTYRSREDFRLHGCRRNLQAIAMATLEYEHSAGYFPAGMIWSLEPGRAARESSLRTGAGALVAILPHLDRNSAFAALNCQLPIHTPQNTTVCGWDVSGSFACPADSAYLPALIDDVAMPGGLPGVRHRVTKSNYAAIAGPWVANTWKIHGVGTGERSSFPEIARNQLGVFNVHSRVRLTDITDGTSNTLLFGERSMQTVPEDVRRDTFWWFSGNHGDTLLSTMFPPVAAGAPCPFEIAALAPSSQHEGIVQFAYADGSVRPTRIEPGAAAQLEPAPVPRQNLPHLQGFVMPQVTADVIGPDPFWDTVFQLRSGARFTLLQRLSTREGDGPAGESGL